MVKSEIICECGFTVGGTSDKSANANMKQHKKSRIHKMLIKNKTPEMGGKK